MPGPERCTCQEAIETSLADIKANHTAERGGARLPPSAKADGPRLLIFIGQSKVSYHVKKLKEAGLISEEKRGRWSFYSLDQGAVRGLLGEAAGCLAPEDMGESHERENVRA
jgi:DNA-binding transcriptional ArsR family regulator